MARLTDIMKEEDPCWDGYKQIGMKKKGSKEVPNCVPESVNEEKVYIDFLNKKKGFKQDRIKFTSYEAAVKWAKKNFDNFNPDMIKFESVNEGHFGEIDIMANEAEDFRDFVKEFYKEYKNFPKNKDSIKWLEGIYRGRSKMEGLDKDGLERVAQGLPQTEEEPISENSLSDLEKKLKSHDWWYAYSDDNRKYKSGEANWFEITKMIKGMKGNKEAEKLWNKYSPKDFNYSFKELSETQLDEGIFKIGIKHIIPLIPTGYAPNDPKYKMDLRILRNMLNSFYNERGYDKVILPTF